jgi:predicted AlkP superfamily phosphohydrolase/phosphomutase
MSKTLVVGWDGATWDYIDPLIAKGHLSHLGMLLQKGTRATLRSTIPPYTNIAWPSLVTGLAPAETKVFDAVQLQPGSYEPVPSNLISFRGLPIWHWVNRYEHTAGVLNVPMTFPATGISGYLVSGFDSPQESDRVAFPPNILLEWENAYRPYQTLTDEVHLMSQQNPHHPRSRAADFARDWCELMTGQGEYAAWLWQNYPVDLMFVVFSGTDSINHRTHDFDLISQVYEAADKALGMLLDAVDDDTIICIVSDHGSLPADHYVSINRILADGGFISYKRVIAKRFLGQLPRWIGRFWRQLPLSVQQAMAWPILQVDGRLAVAHDNIDWAETEAFAVSSLGAIYINRADRFPHGTVSEKEYEAIRRKLIDHLGKQTSLDGKPLFQKIHMGEALFTKEADKIVVPDIVCMPEDWSHHFITGYPSDPVVRPISDDKEYGTHDPNGIFLLAGPKIRSNHRLATINLTDVVPTLLTLWGIPIPDNVSGSVLQEAFTKPIQPAYAPAVSAAKALVTPDEDENDEIINRLRALGYL